MFIKKEEPGKRQEYVSSELHNASIPA